MREKSMSVWVNEKAKTRGGELPWNSFPRWVLTDCFRLSSRPYQRTWQPKRGITGSSGSTMSNFLRNRQTLFQSGFTSLQSHQQWRSVPLSPHPHQHLLSPEFLILAILTGVRWNLRVVLICISLMIKDVEHFFRCFSAIRYSSVENSLFSSVPHF